MTFLFYQHSPTKSEKSFPERLYKSSKDAGPKDLEDYELMHNHKNCGNEKCLMNSKYNSTIGTSFAPVELTQAPISTCLLSSMLPSAPKLIDSKYEEFQQELREGQDRVATAAARKMRRS